MPAWTIFYVVFFWVLLACICAASWRWGDAALRSASTWYVGLVILGRLLLHHPMYRQFEIGQFLADSALLVAFCRLTIRYRRPWLPVISALQLLACLGHVAGLIYHPSRLGYALMTGIGGYPILLFMMMAVTIQFRTQSIQSRRPATGSPGGTRMQ